MNLNEELFIYGRYLWRQRFWKNNGCNQNYRILGRSMGYSSEHGFVLQGASNILHTFIINTIQNEVSYVYIVGVERETT